MISTPWFHWAASVLSRTKANLDSAIENIKTIIKIYFDHIYYQKSLKSAEEDARTRYILASLCKTKSDSIIHGWREYLSPGNPECDTAPLHNKHSDLFKRHIQPSIDKAIEENKALDKKAKDTINPVLEELDAKLANTMVATERLRLLYQVLVEAMPGHKEYINRYLSTLRNFNIKDYNSLHELRQHRIEFDRPEKGSPKAALHQTLVRHAFYGVIDMLEIVNRYWPNRLDCNNACASLCTDRRNNNDNDKIKEKVQSIVDFAESKMALPHNWRYLKVKPEELADSYYKDKPFLTKQDLVHYTHHNVYFELLHDMQSGAETTEIEDTISSNDTTQGNWFSFMENIANNVQLLHQYREEDISCALGKSTGNDKLKEKGLALLSKTPADERAELLSQIRFSKWSGISPLVLPGSKGCLYATGALVFVVEDEEIKPRLDIFYRYPNGMLRQYDELINDEEEKKSISFVLPWDDSKPPSLCFIGNTKQHGNETIKLAMEHVDGRTQVKVSGELYPGVYGVTNGRHVKPFIVTQGDYSKTIGKPAFEAMFP